MTNWSLSVCLLLLTQIVSCRFAAVKHHLYDSVCRSPTAYFLLVEKVGKAPPKPRWFRTSRFLALAHAAHQTERSSVSCFSHQDPSHPTSPAGPRRQTLQYQFADSAHADGRNCAVVNFNTKTRHSKAKAATDFPTAGAGERGKRFVHSIPSCRKQD